MQASKGVDNSSVVHPKLIQANNSVILSKAEGPTAPARETASAKVTA